MQIKLKEKSIEGRTNLEYLDFFNSFVKKTEYMSHISDRVNNLEESATIAMASKSRELIAEGKDIISLSLGEPDFHTPDFVK